MNRCKQGFTLLEMLISIAVFSLISLSGRQMLQSIIDVDILSGEHNKTLTEMNLAMYLISSDIVQIVPRTLRGGDGSREPALLSGPSVLNSEYEGIRFVRAGVPNPQMQLPRSHLSKIGYRIQQGNLQRLSWPVVDAPTNVQPVVQNIIEGAKDLEFYFYDGNKWVRHWELQQSIPLAIKMNVTTIVMGSIERVWLLKGPQMKFGSTQ